MTVASRNLSTYRRMTLSEYLTYDDGTDMRYELMDGVLIEMGTESTINTQIAGFLYGFFVLFGLPTPRIAFKQKIEVRSAHASARDPDLIIHSPESRSAIRGRSEACLFLHEPNPLIVIEIVSLGTESTDNYQRDYVQKPAEYADRGIGEFWQVDFDRAWVRVGSLTDGAYQFVTFQGDVAIVSLTFPAMRLTAAQVLSADED